MKTSMNLLTEFNEKAFIDSIRLEVVKEERISAIHNMIRYGVPKEKILQNYTEEEYDEAEKLTK